MSDEELEMEMEAEAMRLRAQAKPPSTGSARGMPVKAPQPERARVMWETLQAANQNADPRGGRPMGFPIPRDERGKITDPLTLTLRKLLGESEQKP